MNRPLVVSKKLDDAVHPRLAFLHTASVHVATFTELLNRVSAKTIATHSVAESLLSDARSPGHDHPEVLGSVRTAVQSLADQGATLNVCTCSTIGSIVEKIDGQGQFTTMRIDRAMADEAVLLGPRILVVAALQSTLAPTKSLIQESAFALRRQVQQQELLVSDAWPHFERGNSNAYLQSIEQAVRGSSFDATVVVLAQASMADTAGLLGDLSVPVLSSPELGVQAAIQRLQILS